ncbi:hypothetical protein [Halomarina rubra]|uniref:Uncharacterized protein n=1 Tax=Halomarina rubra TaxID=2071873 RepID=A0ABD6ARR1_9EURY|nr:hypothetical protein [Halomarina rubra]
MLQTLALAVVAFFQAVYAVVDLGYTLYRRSADGTDERDESRDGGD